jgi:phospholipid-transporting ATPase
MVHLIKFGVPGVRTLSIGDGANDVAMIQEAHIGVGIRGEEGLQAVNASDYAIAQFRFLKPLLLKHGRSNYIRMCSLVCFMFYKNIFMSICQFWFAWLNGFSGQKIYTEAAIQLYNLVFTALPIILTGIYDFDVDPSTMYRFPELYIPCIDNEFFKPSVFWGWLAHGILESLLCAYLSPLFLHHGNPDTGTFDTFWMSGALTFTCIIVIVNLKMFFIQYRWKSLHVASILMSIASWVVIAYIVTNIIWVDYDWFQIWAVLLTYRNFWIGLLLICTIVVGKDLYLCGLKRSFDPTSAIIVQELVEMQELSGDETGEGNDLELTLASSFQSAEAVSNDKVLLNYMSLS